MSIKLYLFHNGDSSVGIEGEEFVVDYPLEVSSVEDMDTDEKEELDIFRERMCNLYSEYTDFRMMGNYCFELKQMNKENFIKDFSKWMTNNDYQ